MRRRTTQRVTWPLALLVLASCAGREEPGAPSAGPTAVVARGLEALAAPEAKEAIAAARAGLQRFLDAIPPEKLASFGFADRAELARATLAAPYEMWTNDAQASGIATMGEWRFPVTVDGAYRALLTVSQVDGKYRAVNLGGAALAQELGGVERDRAVAPGARRVLLRLPALRSDLAGFPAAGARIEDSPFQPLASASAAYGGLQAAVTPRDLMPRVRERLEALPTHP